MMVTPFRALISELPRMRELTDAELLCVSGGEGGGRQQQR